jgi:hypothetical protein
MAMVALWLCPVAVPYGCALWLCPMVVPYGCALWLDGYLIVLFNIGNRFVFTLNMLGNIV